MRAGIALFAIFVQFFSINLRSNESSKDITYKHISEYAKCTSVFRFVWALKKTSMRAGNAWLSDSGLIMT